MNRMIYLFAALLPGVALSCEETIVLDSDQVQPMIVIEGLVTNQERRHYVRVTRSNEFYDLDDVSEVPDATVLVEDDQGNSYNFEYTPEQDPGSDGYYFSEEAFAGVVGSTYTLSVTTGGKVYTASDTLQPVTTIDSLTVAINRNEFQDPTDAGYFYEVLIYAREPQDREDYYLFKFYRNDSIILSMETDIYFVEDELFGEEIAGVPMAGFYKIGDVARLEMYSLSRQAFIYYNDLSILLNSDGGMFSPPPANPRTNLSNGALGYFQTSALAVKRREVN